MSRCIERGWAAGGGHSPRQVYEESVSSSSLSSLGASSSSLLSTTAALCKSSSSSGVMEKLMSEMEQVSGGCGVVQGKDRRGFGMEIEILVDR